MTLQFSGGVRNCLRQEKALGVYKDLTRYAFFDFYPSEGASTPFLGNVSWYGTLTTSEHKTSIFGAPTSVNTSSDETWATAQAWLDHCEENHEKCKDQTTPAWYPTRLLDIEDRAACSVRLVLKGWDVLSRQYATLSHCWGKNESVRTQRSTVANLRAGISKEKLPRTFREAIIVTHRLGLQYLWIDSLCILQDKTDLTDWIAESSHMERIYASAYCNTAATASADSPQGLFRERNPLVLRRTEVEAFFSAVTPGLPFRRFTLFDSRYLDVKVHYAPLNKRAWVFQGRMLARRTLHFTRAELMWDCRGAHTMSEAYPLGFSLTSDGVHANPSPNCLTEVTENADDKPQKAFDLWQDIQNSCSLCQLTNPNDKLLALSGLAKRIHHLVSDHYVAGMWLGRLKQQILWFAVDPWDGNDSPEASYQNPQQRSWRAPSWSWAAVDCRTMSNHWSDSRPLRILIDIDNVKIITVSGEVTGLLKEASLHLHGSLKLAHIRHDHYTQITNVFINGTELCRSGAYKMVYPDIPGFDFDVLSAENALFYVPARQCGVELEGLLLQLLHRQQGTYRRLGILRSVNHAMIVQLLAYQPEEQRIPCLQYHPDSDARHTILLI